MKKIFLLILQMLASTAIIDAQDLIILRNGEDILCKVQKMDNGVVTYQAGEEMVMLPVTQIYLIKYENRGNAFFSKTGETTYSTKVTNTSKKDILIYLCSGSEIKASELNISPEILRYLPSTNSGKKFFSNKATEDWVSISKEEVFLIRYPDGTKDIINNLQEIEEQTRIETLPKCKHPFIPINKEAGYPIIAELELNDSSEISVIIYDSDRTYIHYRTKDWQNGPIFRMSRSKIKSIMPK